MFFGYWVAVGIWKYSGLAAQATRQAVQPIPSPAQIAAQFKAQYGRDPSFEEVNAIHQMLTRRRNENVVKAGALVGAPFLASHL